MIFFKEQCDRRFAETFGTQLGYTLLETDYHYEKGFVYATPTGQELDAIRRFEAEDTFVDSAELHDLKKEQRWTSLDHGVQMIQQLRVHADSSDGEFSERVREICVYLTEKFK